MPSPKRIPGAPNPENPPRLPQKSLECRVSPKNPWSAQPSTLECFQRIPGVPNYSVSLENPLGIHLALTLLMGISCGFDEAFGAVLADS